MSMDNALYNVMDNTSTTSLRTNNSSACRACNMVTNFSSIWSLGNFSSIKPKTDTSQQQRQALFSEKYTLGQKLGSGTYSTVRIGVHNEQNITYAIKIIPKISLNREDKLALRNEVEILHSTSHPNIIKLYAVYREPRFYYLVTEYCIGGELFERIVKKTKYTEKETIQICRTVLDAISYIHEHKIVHRDIKPENLLLYKKDDDIHVKISDFGFAKRVTTAKPYLTTRCGSPNYVAPEIISRTPYSTPADIWSIGVVIYILLCGYLPFADTNHVILYRKIKQVRYTFHHTHWNKISNDAKDFITLLLVREPSQRLTAKHALSHWWLRPRLSEEDHLKNVAAAAASSNIDNISNTELDNENDDDTTLSKIDEKEDKPTSEIDTYLSKLSTLNDDDKTDKTSQLTTSTTSSEETNSVKTEKICNSVERSYKMNNMSSSSKLSGQRKFRAACHAVVFAQNLSRRSVQQ